MMNTFELEVQHQWFTDFDFYGYRKRLRKKYSDVFEAMKKESPFPYYLEEKCKDKGTESYIAVVWLNEIEETKSIKQYKIDNIKKWADKKTLTRLMLKDDKLHSPIKLPILSRIVLDDKPYLYEITDGVHRIAVAKELGLDFILAYIEEEYYETIDNPTEGKAEI